MSSHGDDLLVQGLIATSEAGERMRAVGGATGDHTSNTPPRPRDDVHERTHGAESPTCLRRGCIGGRSALEGGRDER